MTKKEGDINQQFGTLWQLLDVLRNRGEAPMMLVTFGLSEDENIFDGGVYVLTDVPPEAIFTVIEKIYLIAVSQRAAEREAAGDVT